MEKYMSKIQGFVVHTFLLQSERNFELLELNFNSDTDSNESGYTAGFAGRG